MCEVLASVPRDRLLVETDAPYLSPHPLRGKMNHSGNIEYTLSTFADVLGTTSDEASELTLENAKKIYNL